MTTSSAWHVVTPGVVTLPDGVAVRVRGLRGRPPEGPEPDLGVYLSARDPGHQPWPHLWIPWPDFRLPRHPGSALRMLRASADSAQTQRVEIACRGGIGRSGCALAVLAIDAGVPPTEAVDWVREHLHPRAVETRWQRRWVESVTPRYA